MSLAAGDGKAMIADGRSILARSYRIWKESEMPMMHMPTELAIHRISTVGHQK